MHHIVFVITLVSLTLLIIWWSVFIYRSIEERTELRRSILAHELSDIHDGLTADGDPAAPTGPVPDHPGFMITERLPGPGSIFIELAGIRPGLFLMVDEQIIREIDRDEQRKKLMVTGETGLLALVVLISIIFLFKFINLEKRSVREMEEFWGRVSHEIKTPIAGIRSFLESLKSGSIGKDKLPGFIDLALKQVGKQEMLAENVLTGSSFRSSIKLNPEEFDVGEFLKSYVGDHSMNLTDGRVDLKIPGPVPLTCDRYGLEVILDNLIHNAAKYSSGNLKMIIAAERSGKNTVISLKDNGPGFSQEQEQRIFNAYKYSRTELPDTPHGTGMGLYISRKLARQMGGELEAESEGPGEGAVFRLILPGEN